MQLKGMRHTQRTNRDVESIRGRSKKGTSNDKLCDVCPACLVLLAADQYAPVPADVSGTCASAADYLRMEN